MTDKLNLDIGFQRLLIKLSLSDTAWFEKNREFFDPSYFDTFELQTIAKEAVDFNEKHGTPPDSTVVSSIIKTTYDGDAQKAILAECSAIDRVQISPARAAYAVENLRKFATTQKFKGVLIRGFELLESGSSDEMRGLFDEAAGYGEINESEAIQYLDLDDATRRANADPALDRIPTLFRTIDKRSGGGPSRKELWVFMAPTNRGKSIGLVNIGFNALLMGKNVLYVTAEMSDKKVASRFDLRLTGMSQNQIYEDPAAYTEKLKKFRALHKGKLIIKEFPARSASVRDIENFMLHTQRQLGIKIDLLLVDYLDELRRPKAEKDYIAIGHVTASLHALVKKHNLVGWTATQTNRSAFSMATFDLDAVGDSWEKVKIVDVVLGMCQTPDEYEQNVQRWYQLKVRDNRRFLKPIWLETNFSRMAFREFQDGESSPSVPKHTVKIVKRT